MRQLNTNEIAQIAGGFTPTQSAAMGAIGGLAAVGAQKIAIDALKPICSVVVDVNAFSVFIGAGFGSAEHISHLITATIGIAAVTGLAHYATQD